VEEPGTETRIEKKPLTRGGDIRGDIANVTSCSEKPSNGLTRTTCPSRCRQATPACVLSLTAPPGPTELVRPSARPTSRHFVAATTNRDRHRHRHRHLGRLRHRPPRPPPTATATTDRHGHHRPSPSLRPTPPPSATNPNDRPRPSPSPSPRPTSPLPRPTAIVTVTALDPAPDDHGHHQPRPHRQARPVGPSTPQSSPTASWPLGA
jgi:hypothetical protein